MPTTAHGYIMSSAGGRFTATYIVDGLITMFNGNYNPAIGPICVNDATLTFTSPNELTSTRSFHGVVGATGLSLTFSNGPSTAGDLQWPLEHGNSVNGSGVWIMN